MGREVFQELIAERADVAVLSLVREVLIPQGLLDARTADIFSEVDRLRCFPIGDRREQQMAVNELQGQLRTVCVNATEEDRLRQRQLRTVVRDWMLNRTDATDGDESFWRGYGDGRSFLEAMFVGIGLEEELAGTNTLADLLFVVSRQSTEFSLAECMADSYRRMGTRETFGLEVSVLPTQLLPWVKSGRKGRDAFANIDGGSSDNQARPIRLICLYGQELSSENIGLLVRLAGWQSPASLLYLPAWASYMSEQEVLNLAGNPLAGLKQELNLRGWDVYSVLNRLPGFVSEETFNRLVYGAVEAGCLYQLHELFEVRPDFFATDRVLQEKMVDMVEKEVGRRGFHMFGLTIPLVKALLGAYFSAKEGQDWYASLVRTGLLLPAVKDRLYVVASRSMTLGEVFNELSDEEVVSMIPDYFSRLSWDVADSQVSQLGNYLLGRGFGEAMMIEVIGRARRQGVNAGQLTTVFWKDAVVGNVEAMRLPERARWLLLFLAASQGSHQLVGQWGLPRMFEFGEATEGGPYEAFLAALERAQILPKIERMIPRRLFNREQLDWLREHELGSVEALAGLTAYCLEQGINQDSLQSLQAAAREWVMDITGLGKEGLVLFEGVRSKSERQAFYTQAIGLANLRVRLSDLGGLVTDWMVGTYSKRNKIYPLASLLDHMRTALQLAEDPEEAWGRMTEGLNEVVAEGGGVERVQQFLRQCMSNHFKQAFRLDIRGDISAHITSLEKKWGGLEVLYRAVGRYRELEGEGEQLIEALSKAVEAELKGRFLRYKYDDQMESGWGEGQLAALTIAEKRRWRKNYSELIVVRDSGTDITEGEIETEMVRSRQFFVDQATVHYPMTFGEAEPDADVVDELIALFASVRPEETAVRDVLVEVDRQHEVTRPQFLAITLRSLIVGLKRAELDDARAVVVAKVLGNDYHSMLRDLGGDLKKLAKDLDRRRFERKREDVVLFTTTSGSLRTLLDIGDLVPNCGSCQSLTTGGIMGTTLGPAIDAHTKLVATFLIKPHELSPNPVVAQRMMDQIGKGEVTARFDDSGLRLELLFGNGDRALVSLAFAVSRRKLMVGELMGKSKGPARLIVEPEYRVMSQPGIRESQERIIRRQGIPLANGGERVSVRASKSPGGIWIDGTWKDERDDFWVDGGKNQL